jgi:two-component system sensor histidine kinase CreC
MNLLPRGTSLATRLLVAFAGAVALSSFGLAWWGLAQLRPRYLEATESALVDTAELAAAMVAVRWRDPPDPSELAAVCTALDRRRLDARIYDVAKTRVELDLRLTAADGRVLYDSADPTAIGGDGSQWNDVIRTLRGGYGARASLDGDGVRRLHIAAPVVVDGRTVAVLSVVTPEVRVESFVALAGRSAIVAGLAALAAALLAAGLAAWWIAAPLRRLADDARRMRAGERIVPAATGPKEVRAVAEALGELRAALEGRDYVERYVQTLTHELKSPLAGIAGAVEVLGEAALTTADRERFLGHLRHESGRIRDLVDRLLGLAVLERRSGLVDPQPIDLAALVQAEATAVGIGAIGADGPAMVRGEAVLLATAVRNLLINAVEMEPTGGSVAVSVRASGGMVVVAIRDHGPGFPAFALPRLGERFFALPRPASGRKGTGLGLAFVREIAALHRGRLELGNHRDGGAEATLILPAG